MNKEQTKEMEKSLESLESLEALGWPEIDCDHGAMPDSHDADFMSLAVKAYKLGFEAGRESGFEDGVFAGQVSAGAYDPGEDDE